MKSFIVLLFISGIAFCQADSTDIKRIDKKLAELDQQYQAAEQRIKQLQDLQNQLIGRAAALKEERDEAEKKLKKKSEK